jgi:signal transduction histidine kinase
MAHGSQGGAVIVISDVTESERLERLRREFVANASHELRAPLTSIRGFLQALGDGTAQTEEDRQRCIQIAAEQARMMKRLVDQLLDLSRLQAGVAELDREPVAMPALVQAAMDSLSPQATARGARLVLDAPAAVPAVSADGGRLMQVMVNLLDNAIRYSPQGGQVTVRVSPERHGAREGVRVEVQDQGPGIAAGDLEAVWERFHKVDRARQRSESGAGLGLAIAREIIHAHGGDVQASNASVGGAILAFWLPVA